MDAVAHDRVGSLSRTVLCVGPGELERRSPDGGRDPSGRTRVSYLNCVPSTPRRHVANGNRKPADQEMRFDLALAMNQSWETTLEIARTAERAGLHGLHTSDHLSGVTGEDADRDCFEAWSMLAALAASTQRLRLGVMVSGNTYRHPVILAKMAATIDHVSGGRVELGIGTSWSRGDHDSYGIPFPPYRERCEALAEALEIIHLLWSGSRSDFRGRHYTLHNAPFAPKPLQHLPPVTVGGSSDAVLSIVARNADCWNGTGSFAYISDRLAALDRQCDEIGRPRDAIRRSIFVRFEPTATDAEADAKLQKLIHHLESVGKAGEPTARYASPGEPAAEIARASLLVGTPSSISDQVARWRDLGIQQVVMLAPDPFPSHLVEAVATRLILDHASEPASHDVAISRSGGAAGVGPLRDESR